MSAVPPGRVSVGLWLARAKGNAEKTIGHSGAFPIASQRVLVFRSALCSLSDATSKCEHRVLTARQQRRGVCIVFLDLPRAVPLHFDIVIGQIGGSTRCA